MHDEPCKKQATCIEYCIWESLWRLAKRFAHPSLSPLQCNEAPGGKKIKSSLSRSDCLCVFGEGCHSFWRCSKRNTNFVATSYSYGKPPQRKWNVSCFISSFLLLLVWISKALACSSDCSALGVHQAKLSPDEMKQIEIGFKVREAMRLMGLYCQYEPHCHVRFIYKSYHRKNDTWHIWYLLVMVAALNLQTLNIVFLVSGSQSVCDVNALGGRGPELAKLSR